MLYFTYLRSALVSNETVALLLESLTTSIKELVKRIDALEQSQQKVRREDERKDKPEENDEGNETKESTTDRK